MKHTKLSFKDFLRREIFQYFVVMLVVFIVGAYIVGGSFYKDIVMQKINGLSASNGSRILLINKDNREARFSLNEILAEYKEIHRYGIYSEGGQLIHQKVPSGSSFVFPKTITKGLLSDTEIGIRFTRVEAPIYFQGDLIGYVAAFHDNSTLHSLIWFVTGSLLVFLLFSALIAQHFSSKALETVSLGFSQIIESIEGGETNRNGNTLSEVIEEFASIESVVRYKKIYTEGLQKDISELDTRFKESARFITMGELAGGIAHEINNPLMIISGSIKQILRKLDDHPQILEENQEALNKIDKMCLRIANLTRSLLKMARSGQKEWTIFTISDVLDEVATLAEIRLRTSGTELYTNFTDTDIFLKGDFIQYTQIFLNLVMNSVDALDEIKQGRRQVSIESLVIDEGWLEVTVRDNGPGFPDEYRSQVFKTHFTTKVKGKGTGLGLSLTHNMVKDNGGTIDLLDLPNEAVFELRFPIYEGDKFKGTA